MNPGPHYPTTPSESDRAYARHLVERAEFLGASPARLVAWLLGERLDAIRAACSEGHAQIIAAGRALYDAYRDDAKELP